MHFIYIIQSVTKKADNKLLSAPNIIVCLSLIYYLQDLIEQYYCP